MAPEPMVSIGFIAKRTGNAVSLIRYYANEGLIPSVRTNGGNRAFPRSVIRRVSFILIAQNMGYSLSEIKNLLSTLPDNRTPTQADWAKLSTVFNQHIEAKIAALTSLKTSLEGCIGCGCLSLDRCRLYNTDDKVAAQGSGAQLLDENVQSQFLVSHKKQRFMHPKNLHKNGYPMDTLCQTYPALKSFLVRAKSGNTSIDFTSPKAVKVLNSALLHHYYRLEYWDIPDGYLCPPVPGRADYIHGIADLLKSTSSSAQGEQRQQGKDQNVRGLDIGVGANAIYPIIGVTSYDWSFVGSDVDDVAVKSAKAIASKNSVLAHKFQVRKQANRASIFNGVIEANERFTFTMCNPPFHKSAQEALSGTRRKTSNLTRNKQKRSGTKFTDNHEQGFGHRTSKLQGKNAAYQGKDANLNFAGQANELWCEGGELAFIQRMVKESVSVKDNVEWFTCLVSKSAHLKPIKTSIDYYGAAQCKVIDMGQGSKLSRFVAWTFSRQFHTNVDLTECVM